MKITLKSKNYMNKKWLWAHPEGELDMAAALDLAVRRLASSAQEDRKNYLVLCCGGKSTAGLIRFQDTPVYRMDVDASVRELTEKLHLDMSGVDEVIWYGCGDYGSDGQPALSPAERDRLKEFYRKLFTALGAKKITFRDDLPGVDRHITTGKSFRTDIQKIESAASQQGNLYHTAQGHQLQHV